MKRSLIALTGLVTVAGLGYSAITAVKQHVERKSAIAIERTLSANTIHQLRVLSEIESSLTEGNIDLAKDKLTEAKSTMVYILQSNCSLPECKEALRNHEVE